MSRQERVTEAIKKEVSIIIHDELHDPRLGFVTITRVELTPDLRYAKISYSVLGKEEDYQKTKQAFDSALGFIRRLVSERINLRFAPEIVFREDRSTEYSVRIQEVLNQIHAPEESKPGPDERARTKTRKEGRRESKKGSRVHKKK